MIRQQWWSVADLHHQLSWKNQTILFTSLTSYRFVWCNLDETICKKNHETRSSNMFHTKHQIVGGLGGLKTPFPFPFPPPPPLDHLPLVLVYHSVLVFLHLPTLPKRIKNGWWIKSQWCFPQKQLKSRPIICINRKTLSSVSIVKTKTKVKITANQK